MKSFVVQASRRTSRSPDEVMREILDPHTWSRWQPEIVETMGPSPLSVGDIVEGEAHMLGFKVSGRSHTVEVDPGAYEEEVIVGVRMRIRYEVIRTGEGTEVRRELLAVLPGGLLGRALSRLLRPRLRRMNDQVLAELTK